MLVGTHSDHAAGQEVSLEPLNRHEWSVSFRSLSKFWIQLDYYWKETTRALSSWETLSRFSKLEPSLICSCQFVFYSLASAAWILFLCTCEVIQVVKYPV